MRRRCRTDTYRDKIAEVTPHQVRHADASHLPDADVYFFGAEALLGRARGDYDDGSKMMICTMPMITLRRYAL